LQALLDTAAAHSMRVCFATYTRASFLFPRLQPQEYQSFESEVDILSCHLPTLAATSSAHVLGDRISGLQWHIYTAGAPPLPIQRGVATGVGVTMEVAMTGLDAERAAQFFRGKGFTSAADVTAHSGIAALVPDAAIDDYVFQPCGCAAARSPSRAPRAWWCVLQAAHDCVSRPVSLGASQMHHRSLDL
jgi:S-adenosylmethionine decarboxylase